MCKSDPPTILGELNNLGIHEFQPRKPVHLGALTEDEFNAAIEKGMADLAEGRVVTSETVANNMRLDYFNSE